ncbi:MAG: hypothetical protein HY760_02535, partial [Nitrospirae bacterium]|nr:hypothetical protein [Nitrospirota bacterium]
MARGEEPFDPKIFKTHQRPLEILKIIAVSPHREVSKNRLIDYLYGDDTDGDKASAAFQKALVRLRALLAHPDFREGQYLVNLGGRYSLHPDYTWVDLEEFVKLSDMGKRYRELGMDNEAVDAFLQADQLWQGTLLEGDDAEPWLAPQREKLEKIRIDLLLETARLLIKRQDFTAAESCIRKSQVLNPDFEEGVRILSLTQDAQGKKIDAL